MGEGGRGRGRGFLARLKSQYSGPDFALIVFFSIEEENYFATPSHYDQLELIGRKLLFLLHYWFWNSLC